MFKPGFKKKEFRKRNSRTKRGRFSDTFLFAFVRVLPEGPERGCISNRFLYARSARPPKVCFMGNKVSYKAKKGLSRFIRQSFFTIIKLKLRYQYRHAFFPRQFDPHATMRPLHDHVPCHLPCINYLDPAISVLRKIH